jgi:dTDP-4-dehydrorhamnose 3,5-epimerase
VRIPPGVAHGCRNLRPATTSTILYFVDVQFTTDETCDEGRLPWDHFGTQVWEVERG